MKKMRNKKLCAILTFIIAFTSLLSLPVFANEITPVLVTNDDSGIIPLGTVTPSCPLIIETTFVCNGSAQYHTFQEGNNVVISAAATDKDGNSVPTATLHVELIEYETNTIVAKLNTKADGEAVTADGVIVPGRRYYFKYTMDMLHMDTWFTARMVAVVY